MTTCIYDTHHKQSHNKQTSFFTKNEKVMTNNFETSQVLENFKIPVSLLSPNHENEAIHDEIYCMPLRNYCDFGIFKTYRITLLSDDSRTITTPFLSDMNN